MTKVLGNVLERRRKVRSVSVQSLADQAQRLHQETAAKDEAITMQQERNAEIIALLDSFDKQAEEGDPEQQRREFAEFQQGIDAARPGQRSIFGEGFNP